MKILLADDHALFRDGLILNIKQQNIDAEINSSGSYREALDALKNAPYPEAIILDLDMPDMSWQQGLPLLQKTSPKSKIIIVSAIEDAAVIKQVMNKGVKGYIPKRLEPKVIMAAIKLVLEGGTYLPPQLLKNISDKKTKNKDKKSLLTPRQKEVLQYIAQGLSNKQIAYEMQISEATVKLHINALLKALKANNRTQALVMAQKLDIIKG